MWIDAIMIPKIRFETGCSSITGPFIVVIVVISNWKHNICVCVHLIPFNSYLWECMPSNEFRPSCHLFAHVHCVHWRNKEGWNKRKKYAASDIYTNNLFLNNVETIPLIMWSLFGCRACARRKTCRSLSCLGRACWVPTSTPTFSHWNLYRSHSWQTSLSLSVSPSRCALCRHAVPPHSMVYVQRKLCM